MDLIINLNKPPGITSQDAVTKVKKLLKAKKAGHAGTLDPSATGVLLVCLNRATRLASYFSSLDKEYRAVIKLGEATDTQDAEGNVIEKCDKIEVTEAEIKSTLSSFTGDIQQEPPMFSALKHKGKPLYKYARKGITIARKPREIRIDSIDLHEVNLPYAEFVVRCSKGTYIRTLCNDIGKKLGVCGHLFKLERTAIGPFRVSDAVDFDGLDNDSGKGACPVGQDALRPNGMYPFRKPGFLPKGMYTMDSALSWMPDCAISESQGKAVSNGAPLSINDCSGLSDNITEGMPIKVKSPDGTLIAVGSFQPHKKIIKMDVVFG
ncbi:MAG TPA: tRNA pseudouridine(55) synthase TruB [Nitrospirae bacterium]|nr:tRNA pseudouridine(55) synthase TruB [Nitrospirota bacterium]